MSQQLRMPCPECKQHHDNPKQVESCLIAALNRWLVLKINNEHTSDYNKAYITFSNLITYYLPILMRDTPTKYYTIQLPVEFSIEHSPDCGTKYRGCAHDCPKASAEESEI